MDPQQVSPEQVDAVLRESVALTDAHGRARRVRFFLFLAVIAFVAVIGYLVVNRANALTNKKYLEKVGDVAMKRFDKDFQKYQKHLNDLISKIRPPITEAFSAQAKKDMPRLIQALEKERDPFLNALQAGFTERLEERFKQMQPTYDRLLKEEFPASKDKVLHDRVVANVNIAVNNILKEYYVKELEREVKALVTAWETFPPAKKPRKGEDPLESQFTAGLWSLMEYRLGPRR